MSHKILEGKKGIIFGALDELSIAWKTAEAIKQAGGEFILTNDPVALRMGKIDELAKNKTVIAELKIYGNAKVKEGSTNLSAEEFKNRMNDKMQTSIDKLKSAAGKKRKESDKEKLLGYLTKNSKKMDSVFALHAALTTAKIKILRKLQKVKSIGTFIKTDDGYEVTAPEGFVAIDKSNKALKLEDRLEFSRQNFTASKNWIKGE